jgi:putative phage-type endonuclease
MKVVSLKQNSKTWYDWRGKGLGASDAPIVMGDSPWSSPFQLWGEKTGLLPKREANAFAIAAMRRGQDMEPEAREAYRKLTGIDTQPIAMEHDVHTFLRASLDGIDKTLTHFVEIKCPGQEAHDKAKKGRIPPYYYAQVQQQFLVSGCTSADYFSYRPGDEKPEVVVPLKPDPTYQAKLLERMTAFWQLVMSKTSPKTTHKEVAGYGEAVEKAKAAVVAAEKAFELAKQALT